MRIILAITSILISMTALAAPADTDTRRLLEELDRAIADRQQYEARRVIIDDSLKAELSATTDTAKRLILIERIARRYQESQIDSAIKYLERGRQEAEQGGMRSKVIRFDAHLTSMLPYRGEAKRALQQLEAADTTGIDPDDIPAIHESATRTYLAAAALFPPSRQQDELIARGRQELGIFAKSLTPGTNESNFINAFICAMDQKTSLAVAHIDSILDSNEPGSRYYAMAYELKAVHCIYNNLAAESYPDLIKALTLQIERGAKTGLSASYLANDLIGRGDTKRANAIIDLAIDNARESGSKIRFNHATQVWPMLADSIRRQSSRMETWVIILAVAAALMASAIVWLILKLRRSRTQTDTLRARIARADSEQAVYFNRFLKLCAIYIERFEDFTRLTRRKIKAAQIDDLYKMLSSGDMFDKQSTAFYEIFDSAFCHAYPTFVHDLNRLLQTDKQVSTPGAYTLTTELRILAFMRLGFDDSRRIAKFLNLSVNTIYTYRNRMRNRAIDRDSFESDLMEIGC